MVKTKINFLKVNVWIFPLCLLLSCCGPKTTLFGTYRATQPTPPKNITRLFLDRDGSIYPDASIPVNEESLRKPIHQLNTKFNGGYLQYYFNFVEPGQYQELKENFKIADRENKTEEWAELQYAMQREVIKQLNQKLALQSYPEGGKTTLVVLIHGFNVNSPQGEELYSPYTAVQSRVSQFFGEGNPVHFLEVYWDRMHGSPFTIWTYAQANASFVGLSLRGLLQGVGEQFPIRVLTHSLGATVAANALWNVRAAKGPKGDYLYRWWMPAAGDKDGTSLSFGRMRQDTSHYSTPRHPNLRLASIAPAQPGVTYLDFLDRTPMVPDSNSWCQRVIIGYNSFDYATNKIIKPLAKAKFGLGSTSLAVYKNEYGKYIYPRTNETKPLDFTDSYWVNLFPKRFFYTGHGLENYLKQPPASELLRLLLLDEPVPSTIPKKGKKVTLKE
jgi:hypothetical protein